MAKTYHHGDLKQAAIAKAVEIIHKKGEVEFTLREIAESLKVSHTAVYRHFRSKKELLSHIAEEGFLDLSAQFREALAPLKSPQQKVEALGEVYIRFAIRKSAHYRTMFHPELRCASEQRKELEQACIEALSCLNNVLAEGMKAQVFRREDSEVLARSVWSSWQGFASLLIDGQFQELPATHQVKINEGIRHHLAFVLRAVLR